MKTDALKAFAILAELGDDDRAELAGVLDVETFGEGQTLFREGDEADALYLIARGSLRLQTEQTGPLGLLCEGTSIGAISVVAIGKREVTAVAETEAEVYVLSRGGFHRIAGDAPRTAVRLAEGIIAELGASLRAHLPQIKRQFSSDEVVLSG